jgi:hypothetical protein
MNAWWECNQYLDPHAFVPKALHTDWRNSLAECTLVVSADEFATNTLAHEKMHVY